MTKSMNLTTARAKAKGLFGMAGFAQIDRYKRTRPYWVGIRVSVYISSKGRYDEMKRIYGTGDTWEQAFDDAAAHPERRKQ